MRKRRNVAILTLALTLVLSTFAAAGATHTDVIAKTIPVSDVDVSLELVADGFTTPLWAINAPGDNKRLFVVDQVGKIWAIEIHPGDPAQVPERSLFLDIGVDGLEPSDPAASTNADFWVWHLTPIIATAASSIPTHQNP